MSNIRTWLVELPPERCAALLRETCLGRLAVVVHGRPEIFPVNHVYDAGTVAFPTRRGSKLLGALEWPWVAYEIDGMERGAGWSVALVGRAEEVTDAEEIAGLAAKREIVWAAGDGAHWLRIVPTKVTGRMISGTSS